MAEKIDVLLDRATDAILRAPRPGSARWHYDWQARNTEAGIAALAQRTRVKTAIAAAAGIDPHHDIERARHTELPTPPAQTPPAGATTGRGRRRKNTAAAARPESGQLAIW